MIDFRYHLVSIVAVFLALAIGIVLGSTALQGDTIDGLKAINNSLHSQLDEVSAQRDSANQAAGTSDEFLQTAEPKLLNGMLAGDSLVLVTEPGAPSAVVSGIQDAAKDAGATITGTITLQPKFNDLSGSTKANLGAINATLATTNGIVLDPGTDGGTVYQQDAAQVIATAVLEQAILDQTTGETGVAATDPRSILQAYAQGGYLTYNGTFSGRTALAVIVTPSATAADGPSDPADQVLLVLAGEFASASAATLVAGPAMAPGVSDSPILVLRNSSVNSQVSSVDNANTRIGQISTIWALADQLQGGKPGSYGTSAGASLVPPLPSPVPSATPTVTPTPKKTGRSARP